MQHHSLLLESSPVTASGQPKQDTTACRQALSAARVLGPLMDLEHRAVHPSLDQLWAITWKCALLDEGTDPPSLRASVRY